VHSPTTILPGTPLETTINVAGGTATTNPDGSATATSDGVSVQALKGLPGGGITLQLAHAEAAVNGTKAVATPAPTPVAVTPRGELPRTGGTPWLPIAGAVLLGIAVIARRSLRRLS
jgi:LPXTG-motif cell wall-anchored protein